MPSIGLILIFFSIYFFDDKVFHPSIYTLIPILGVCLIIWYSNKDEYINKLLSSKIFVSLGLISYSLYLWHYPVFAFARKTEYIHGLPTKKLEIAIIIFILSVITYFFIEKLFPITKQKSFLYTKFSLFCYRKQFFSNISKISYLCIVLFFKYILGMIYKSPQRWWRHSEMLLSLHSRDQLFSSYKKVRDYRQNQKSSIKKNLHITSSKKYFFILSYNI